MGELCKVEVGLLGWVEVEAGFVFGDGAAIQDWTILWVEVEGYAEGVDGKGYCSRYFQRKAA